jgi:hypothetical protein
MPLLDLPEQPRQQTHDPQTLLGRGNQATPAEMMFLRIVIILAVFAVVLVAIAFMRGSSVPS